MTRLTPLQREILTALADGAAIETAPGAGYAINGRSITKRKLRKLVARRLIDCCFGRIAGRVRHTHPISERGLAALGRASAGQGDDDDGRTG